MTVLNTYKNVSHIKECGKCRFFTRPNKEGLGECRRVLCGTPPIYTCSYGSCDCWSGRASLDDIHLHEERIRSLEAAIL